MFHRILIALATLSLLASAAHGARRFSRLGDFGFGGRAVLPPADPCDSALAAKWADLASAGIFLGAPTADSVKRADFCWRTYLGGRIYRTTGGLSTAVWGPLHAKYQATGFHDGPLGRPLSDPTLNADGVGQHARFVYGEVVYHPALGTHAILRPMDRVYRRAGNESRVGYPLDDSADMALGLGAFTTLENAVIPSTPDMGAWLDYTGEDGAGRLSGSVTAWPSSGFGGSSTTFPVSNERPLVFAGQLGAQRDAASSASVAGLRNTHSAFFFEHPDFTGRHLQVRGSANGTPVNVANVGARMNDRLSSVMVVNHGHASVTVAPEDIASRLNDALDAIDTDALLDSVVGRLDATATMDWVGTTTAEVLVGERILRLQRTAAFDVDADCVLVFNCNADGDVVFTIDLRLQILGPYDLTVAYAGGTAEYVSCSGEACGTARGALRDAMGSLAVHDLVTNQANEAISDLNLQLTIAGLCGNVINLRRINVLPTGFEVVLSDAPPPAACANELDTDRPAAVAHDDQGTAVPTTTGYVRAAAGGVLRAR